jgi:hypothetical protein
MEKAHTDDIQVENRLKLMYSSCNDIKMGFDNTRRERKTYEEVEKDCNLHPYCEYDASRLKCINKIEYPELDAEYQKPCSSIFNRYQCEANPKCYYVNEKCKRDATKLSSEEMQEIMNRSVRNLGFTSKQIREANLYHSLRELGFTDEQVKQIVPEIKTLIENGMTHEEASAIIDRKYLNGGKVKRKSSRSKSSRSKSNRSKSSKGRKNYK